MLKLSRNVLRIKSRPFTVATPSDVIKWFPDVIVNDRTSPIVAYCRVSTSDQSRKGNLERQVADVLTQLEYLGVGAQVIKLFQGYESSRMWDDRLHLEVAASYARQHRAILVAESRCRFVRCHRFDGTNKSDPPTESDMSKFCEIVGPVTVATLIHPNESARSRQIIRGQVASGNRGGRPPHCKPGFKKAIRAKYSKIVRSLSDDGKSIRAISNQLAIPKSTVSDWLRATLN